MKCHAPLQAIDRRERLRRLALETIDLSKDPTLCEIIWDSMNADCV